MNYHIAKNRAIKNPTLSARSVIKKFKCMLCYQEIPGFQALRQHKTNQHGFLIKETNVIPDIIINEINDVNLKLKLHPCLYSWVDFELQKATHKIFNFAVENLNE